MEACVHVLSAVPGVITAAVAAGYVDDDKLVAVCLVMEEWMCDDATCTALVWLLALPSAGAVAFPSQQFGSLTSLEQEQWATCGWRRGRWIMWRPLFLF